MNNITEKTNFILNLVKNYRKRKDFDNKFEYIDFKYPGVLEFLQAASEWAEDISPYEDRRLYSLLKSLEGKKTILDLSENDLRRIYKFLNVRRLEDYDDMVSTFIKAMEED